ncbi:hypothetical protein TYRP_000195 [Tyrophagus putrescentiae]|nr:hypothetical protein TYRP_000195 [Tyrophagus putrescentiae]WCD24781.1 Tyr p 37 allergen [Tyrophagus putrescentiae]
MTRLVLWSLAFLLLGTVIASPLFEEEGLEEDVTSGPTTEKVCEGKGDGILVADPKDKSQFYECNHEKAFKFHCPPTLIFSESAKGCVHDPNHTGPTVPCTGTSHFDCKGKPDGFYADSHDKTKYHECDHGCPSDFSCPPYTYFEPSKNVCAMDENAGKVTPTEHPVTPTVTQPVHTDGPHTETHHTEPPHTETPHTESPHTEPHHTEPPHTESPHTEGTHTQAPHTEPTHVTSGPNPEQTTRGRHGGF